jgi:hypothetical protein
MAARIPYLARVISVSLPEAMIWKLDQLNKRYGVPKSRMVVEGLLLLFASYNSGVGCPGMAPLEANFTAEDLVKEYQNREQENGKTE